MKVEKPFGKLLFKEEQQFRQAWLWMLIIISSIIPIILVFALSLQKQQTPVPVFAYVIVIGTAVINVLILYIARFDTVVTDEAIFYRWMPFRKKYTVINRAAIQRIVFMKFTLLKIGYSWSIKYGRSHHIEGNKGVLIQLMDNKKYYLGSQRLAAFHHALAAVKPELVTSEIKGID